jgi:hypothetical protein
VAASSSNSAALGSSAAVAASSPNSTALGVGAGVDTGSPYSTALGSNATVAASSSNSVALGAGATVVTGNSNSVALGAGAVTTASNQIVLGNGTLAEIVPGVNNAVNLGSASMEFSQIFGNSITTNYVFTGSVTTNSVFTSSSNTQTGSNTNTVPISTRTGTILSATAYSLAPQTQNSFTIDTSAQALLTNNSIVTIGIQNFIGSGIPVVFMSSINSVAQTAIINLYNAATFNTLSGFITFNYIING